MYSSETPVEPATNSGPTEAALNLLRQEWRDGCNGRWMDRIQRTITSLESHAPATQTVDVIREINQELDSYKSLDSVGRREALKTAAERLKAIAPQLRAEHRPHGPIGLNPAALRASRGPRSQQRTVARRPDDAVTTLPSVGPSIAARLAQLGISTINDLLRHTPRSYIDFSDPQPIGQAGRLMSESPITIAGKVTEIKTVPGQRSRRIEVRIADGTGWAKLTWFNPYIARQMKIGDEIVVHGQIDPFRGTLSFTGPEWEQRDSDVLSRTRLIPVYPLTQGIGQKQMRRMTRSAIDQTRDTLTDPVPPAVLHDNNLIGLPHAIAQCHFPATREWLADAKRRLSFDEMFFLQVGLAQRKRETAQLVGNDLSAGRSVVQTFINALPFPLTTAQKRAIREVSQDLGRTAVMQRLVQGDVGSGKTVVAAAAALQAIEAGFQVAVMAPTEILARQLDTTLTQLLTQIDGVSVAIQLLTGSTRKRDRREILERLAGGEINILVGTHALIQEGVVFDRLGLTIVDEQHRFGVRQRGELPSKASVGPAHILTMSATPIPRSLNMVLLGDIDVSVIDEMPPGREPIATHRFVGEQRERAYSLVRREVAASRQVFVICPLVEDSQASEMKSVVTETERLQREVFPDLRVGMLHGRMSGVEKGRIMTSFKAHEFDILVATSVIEVGIDVPNATIMMVEGADRFGLAQLHQFRGRVGRGSGQSYCLLLADDATPMGEERLRMMESTTDGFVLAEADLRMRGAGDFLGTRQSGLPELTLLRTGFDTRTLDQARKAAASLVDLDPELVRAENLALKRQISLFWSSSAPSMAGA